MARRPVGGAGTQEAKPSRRGGRNRLTCFPPPGLGGAERGGGAAYTTCGSPDGRQTHTRRDWRGGGLEGPGRREKCEKTNLGERSDLGAGGGVASGGGESEPQLERGWPRKRGAPPTHPGRERRRGPRQAGPGAAGPSTPTVTPRPPAHPQDDEEAAASHAATGPHGQPGTVSVNSFLPAPSSPRQDSGEAEESWTATTSWTGHLSSFLRKPPPPPKQEERALAFGAGEPPALIGGWVEEDQGCWVFSVSRSPQVDGLPRPHLSPLYNGDVNHLWLPGGGEGCSGTQTWVKQKTQGPGSNGRRGLPLSCPAPLPATASLEASCFSVLLLLFIASGGNIPKSANLWAGGVEAGNIGSSQSLPSLLLPLRWAGVPPGEGTGYPQTRTDACASVGS